MTEKNEKILKWSLTILASLIFLVAGVGKLFQGKMVAQQLGFPTWFMYFLGSAEVVGIIGLYIKPFAVTAAISLSTIMVGAVATHIAEKQYLFVLVPVVTEAILAGIWYLNSRPKNILKAEIM